MRKTFSHETDRYGRARLLANLALGLALDTISGFVTAPGATLTAWTLPSGDSLSVRNTALDKKVYLLDSWFFNQAAGIARIRSAKLHDNVQGIRERIPGNSQAFPLQPNSYAQRIYPQDALIVEQSGSAVGGQIETGSLLVWYEDLIGVQANLVGPDEVMKRGIELFTQETVHAAGVAGGYSGAVALNSTIDLMKANEDYALIGYTCDTQICSVAWRGADSGNLRVSGPGNILLRQLTREWFWRLSQRSGLPCIPVFNSANKSAITVDVVNNQVAAVTENLTSIFVHLAPKAK
jgi:hypothetical protein